MVMPEPVKGIRTDIPDGHYVILWSHQVNIDLQTWYNREVTNVISYGGITNASQLMVTFDSSYQKVLVHHLYIWRKGVKIDRTGELNFKMLNNEHNLDNGIYLGQSSAYDILKDIRKDDLIDFAYSIVGFNPIYGNTINWIQALQSYKPIDRLRIRILYGKERELDYVCHKCDSIKISKSDSDLYKVIEITSDNVTAIEPEENMPAWISPYAYFELTSFKSWIEVDQWAQEVFKLDREPKLDEVYAEVFTGNETTDEKINKLIDYVQDEIRYMGVESGIGSIKPSAPETVVSHRYGDCKDKSLLLVSLLRQTGVVKAWPVLVNTYLKHGIADALPGTNLFNHCIVKFEYNDSIYWVDPTNFLQGGNFRTISNYDHGRVLVIGQPNDSLALMAPRPVESSMHFTYQFDSPSFDEPVTLTCTSHRKGMFADQRRVVDQMTSSKDMSDEFLKDLRNTFPSVELAADPEFFDDPVNNEFKIIHHIRIKDFWKVSEGSVNKNQIFYTLLFEPFDVQSWLQFGQCMQRKYDVFIFHPFEITQKYIFNCPKRLNYIDTTDEFDTDAYTYKESFVQTKPNSIQTGYSFRTKTNSITPEQFIKVCEVQNEIKDGLKFTLVFIK